MQCVLDGPRMLRSIVPETGKEKEIKEKKGIEMKRR